MGRAIHDWEMIADGDRIVAGISGGQDSLTLLGLLEALSRRAPVTFEVVPVYVDPGFDTRLPEKVAAYVEDRFGPIRVERTRHGLLAHSSENRENPCFLCSRLRRKKLFEIADEEGCRTVALGHNRDDLIETLLMNMFYSGRISTMKPKQSFFDGRLTIIRPLAYVEKKDIAKLARKLGLEGFDNPCPSAGNTRRATVRQLLETLCRNDAHVKGNLFRAMSSVKPDYLLKRTS